jgi:broad specificity phosphatase PhoE
MSFMKKTVYFVRHGESSMNINTPDSIYGGASATLTQRGQTQANLFAQCAKELPIEVLVASTMLRAQETASTISEQIGKPVESSSLFVERKSPSSFIGRRWNDAETQRLEREWVQTFFQSNIRTLDGENFSDIKNRAAQALEYLQTRPESYILVVSHAFFIYTLIARILLKDTFTPDQFRILVGGLHIDNTGLTVVSYDTDNSMWSLQVWNDHAHLG